MSPCHTCVCQWGSFQCTLHPCASTCTAYGDRHYRTFDGLPFDFVGACKVHLVKSTADLSFSVIVENVDCYSSGIICRKFISINVGNSLLIFDDDSGSPSPESFLDEKQEVHTWQAGFFTLVHFPREHITLLWDQRTTVHIQAGPQWQGQLAGLCGNFDLKTINEMRTPENLELTNPQEFGSSWAAVECPDTLDPWDTCVLNPLREPFARKECSILLSEVFETCHPVVDVTWFYSNCLTDTCGCSRGGDCECFCASVSAYAHQCCQHGVAVGWRTPRLCRWEVGQGPGGQASHLGPFSPALGKGPYQLASLATGNALVASKAAGGATVLMSAGDVAPGDIVNFLLTAALYKAKAHDPDVVSLEAADRPNFFLHVTANGSLELAKWQGSVAFHHHASFLLHRGTGQADLVALESLAEPGSFLYVSGPTLGLQLYEHTEVFRRGTFFRLLDAQPSGAAYPLCEWHYDACAGPCFRTCRDPRATSCRDVPRVEGCVPACPTPKVLDEVTQRCVYLEDCVEPVVSVPTESLGNETLPPSQELPTLSDKELQFPQEAPGAPSHKPTHTPAAPLTTALNPPTAATEGPVLTPGPPPATLQPPSGTTTSNLPARPTEAPASMEVTASHLATPLTPESSSLSLSQPTPTPSMGSGAGKTTRVTVTFAGSPNITVSSRSPPAPRSPLMTKAVTVPGPGSLPIKTTPLQPFPSLELPASSSSRPVASPAVTSRPPTSLGSHKALLTPAITEVMNRTGMPQPIPAQSVSSPSDPLAEARATAEQVPVSALATKRVEMVPPTEKQPGPGQPAGIPAPSPPRPVPTAPLHPTWQTPIATRPPAPPPGTPAAASQSTLAHGLGVTRFMTVDSTRPPQLLPGLPLDTSLPLTKVGTSAPVATPGSKGSVVTFPLQQQATSPTMATTPPTQTLSSAPPLTPAVVAQVGLPSHTAPQAAGTAPGWLPGATLPASGVVAMAEGAASTLSAAPGKSTTEEMAILSKQQSLPPWMHGPAQGVPTKLTPAVAHTLATLAPEADGPWAVTVPLVPTSSPLSRVSARTASRESSLVLLPQLAEAHGTSAGPRLPAELGTEATTKQSGHSAPAQSIAASSAETLTTITEDSASATCVPIAEQDCVRHICLEGQLIRVNQSQHCPQGATPPRCGVLGLAVRVGGDRCCPLWECACRCSIFPDLSFVTFDGSHVALFKEAIYILTRSPKEMVTVHVLDCKSANLGHLNWPPFCLVMLNVTHLTHQVTTDRFNRKVSAANVSPCLPSLTVCESFRCPQVQCGVGTALVEVWSPDRCCPYKSCECDCDTIPVPRCHLWEKSQLDEEFLHSMENVCGCAKYECAKAPVCLSRELGVMLPGQTVVELSADGVCHTSRCTHVLDPLTSFYQINTTSVLCDVRCEVNQEYEHPRDLAACCGSCRNVSCLFTFPNGTTSLFLPGASWVADCARYHCSNTPLGAVLVRSPISCPPLNETECAKAGGSVVPSLEGCCRTCSPGTLFPVVPVSPASPPRVSVHCHPGKEDGRSCKKVTIRMTIRKNECRSNTPVNLVSCDGRCPSASIYNYNINTYARFCKCCREVGLQRRSVQLFCATNATWVPYTVQEPTDCACQWS
ncbi:otogelin [Leptonychotes weddellii]|uniref:Otogelin n=1 Tax=Leptonychotes weddellii TaxID=9713 RepID=A0A7F8QC13_LEPWE|nr:otogelin [Leptonychotes weddellii]